MMLFDRALLAMGNILFLAGTITIIGFEAAKGFFFERHRLRGTACFFVGIIVVLFGWPVTGMLIEMFGFINLFGNFFPVFLKYAIKFGQQLPLVGHLFVLLEKIPGIAVVMEKLKMQQEQFPV